MIKKINKDNWEGIKFRKLPDYNYSAVWNNLSTIRFDLGEVMELPADKSEFYDVSLGNKCCTGKCDFCLLPNVKIATIDGDKEIKDITDGDMVYSFNVEKDNVEIKNVLGFSEREYEGNIIEIETDNNIISVTPNHLIYTLNRGWVKAENIEISDVLLDI